MPLLPEHNDIHILHCQCGWNFLSLSAYSIKCPQCRDAIQSCLCCGKEIEGIVTIRYCAECAKLIKRIDNKYRMQKKRKNFRETVDTAICNYDCLNCQFSDCIQPVDDETLPLFD